MSQDLSGLHVAALAVDSPVVVGGALPTMIGKYRVLGRLGVGSTSEVFWAFDDFHQRDVALKRVLPHVVGAGREARYFERFFAAEAALAGLLLHPNVVQIYDAVADPVAPYLVMEYVRGETLRAFCSPDQLLPLETIVELGFKCAMALGYVYRQGVIHRDIKPANLLTVSQAGQIVDVKVSDFGSALHLAAEVTQVHRVGSLAYMPPEQLDGGALDCRADMYALGAVLYHLITGRAVFESGSQATMMHQIYHQMPVPPSQLRAGVAALVDAVVLRALAKSAQDRYADWEGFARALSELVVGEHIPRGSQQSVLDSERFHLLRGLEFFAGFDDIALWEVVHRAKWERFVFGHALWRSGQEGNSFHILAQGEVHVFRDGQRVAELGAGTSVGEMAYLAPNAELRTHQADVLVTKAATTIAFTPETLAQLSTHAQHLFDQAFIRVLVRRLHAAHERLAHPRRIL